MMMSTEVNRRSSRLQVKEALSTTSSKQSNLTKTSQNLTTHGSPTASLGPRPINSLLKNGFLNVGDVQKLQDAGFTTLESVAYASNKQIMSIKGFSVAKVIKIKAECSQAIPMGFMTAGDYHRKRSKTSYITTGSKELDKLLGGGIESGSITEVFGDFASGKTQLCLTLAVTAQLPSDLNGGNGNCIFVDTEGTFRPERLLATASRYGLDGSKVLDGVFYCRSFNSDHQMRILTETAGILSDHKCSIIIIDGAMSHYRSDYSGRGELADRQMHLGQFLRQLQRLANEFGVAVLITNQVVAVVDLPTGFVGEIKKPVGGNIMAHASTTRLSLRKGKAEQRFCKIYASPSLPEEECVFGIYADGIDDVREVVKQN